MFACFRVVIGRETGVLLSSYDEILGLKRGIGFEMGTRFLDAV